MKKYSILITEPEYFNDAAVKILKKAGRVRSERLSRAMLEKAIPKIDILVVRIETKLDRRILSRAKRLKVIGSATTGLDHIDVEYAQKLGIKIISLHGTHTVPTAEHTFALTLSLARRIPWAYDHLKRGEWKRYEFFGTQLKNKTLGIIGLGRIGSRVAGYAAAFGMKVIAYDPYVKSKEVRIVRLNELLKKSDIISVNAALTKEDNNMISYGQFKLMKKGTLLVNTARGRIVNQSALIDSLRKGRILGAAVDVFSAEPLDKSSPIVKYAKAHENLIITPHLGASTEEAVANAGLEIANEVTKYIN